MFQKYIKVKDIIFFYGIKWEFDKFTIIMKVISPLPYVTMNITFTKRNVYQITKAIPLKTFVTMTTSDMLDEIQFNCNKIHKDIIIDNDIKETIMSYINEYIKF
jgi:hypothetical protein